MSENTEAKVIQTVSRKIQRVTRPILGHWGPAKFSINPEETIKKLFSVTPVCEVCGKEIAVSFACFDGFGNWKFCGNCTRDNEFYTIPIADFVARPASMVDWIAHMSKKHEMDWESFGQMMLRFREITGSKGGNGPAFVKA
jgi:hypothetical protein